MYNILSRHEVQLLARAGLPQERIRQLVGASVRTIRRITKEPPAISTGDPATAPARSLGRPRKWENFVDVVKGWLADEPDLLSIEIFRRLKLKGYTGERTAAYEFIARFRQRAPRLVMRFEGLPGEFTQHDFGEVVVKYLDGRRQKIHFFATRLKYSRWVEVTIVPNQRAETLIRTLHRHFEAIGGIPLLAVFDRPKTIAKKWDSNGKVTQWNPTFEKAMFGLGLGVELCWPYRAQEKGSVERLVGWAKGSFFTQRRFVDYEDLLQQLTEWLHEVNTVRPCRATGVVPAQRLEVERLRLRPLGVSADDFALVYPGYVGPTGEVSFEGALYDMPPAAACMPADLHVFPDRVQIVAGRHSAMHQRVGASQRATLPEHRAQQLAAVHGTRGKRYLKRQHLLDLGGDALDYLTEVVHRRPRSWSEDVDALHQLLQSEGAEAMRSAIHQALRLQLYGGEYVRELMRRPRYAEKAPER